VATILKPCRMPWAVSPSTSGLTLTHCETDVSPECTIVFGAGRMRPGGGTDDRRVELAFEHAAWTRTGPKDDNSGIESAGFEVPGAYSGPMEGYLDWRRRIWLETGICPDSGFYVATKSEWTASLNPEGSLFRHYVLSGRDGYVEILAIRFAWREWLWPMNSRREAHTADADVVASGEGVE
jgi:hypothetical protein